MFLSSSFTCVSTVISILKLIRNNRIDVARTELELSLAKFPFSELLAELNLRLNTDSSPHILIDGIWFLNPYGGIARVWSSFFDFLAIPGFLKPNQLSVICRSTFNYPNSHINLIKGVCCDPLDFHQILELPSEINDIILACGASVFCSSWITFARNSKSFSQLALVHDCIPERYSSNVQLLLDVRRSWISNSDSYICVSSQTSSDLSSFTVFPINSFIGPTHLLQLSLIPATTQVSPLRMSGRSY